MTQKEVLRERIEENAEAAANNRLPVARNVPCYADAWREVLVVGLIELIESRCPDLR
jgi:hypothetical protein